MSRSLAGLWFLVFFLMPIMLWSQANIPLGSWRSHFSYRSAYSLAIANERVYAASANGLYYYDREDNSIRELTTLQGLSDAGISILKYHSEKGILFIGYRNGNIDLVQNGKVYNIRAILNAALPGQRKINHVLFQAGKAFVATDYGVSVLDLQSKDLLESYFSLGPMGKASEVFQLAFWNDSLFAATDKGLISNALQGANLSDFNSWRRYEADGFPLAGEIKTLLRTPEGLFAGVNGKGLVKRQNEQWLETEFKTEKEIRSLDAVGEGVLISVEGALYLFNTGNKSSKRIESPLIDDPRQAEADKEGNIWIADGRNGLLSNFENAFKAYVPQGPLADVPEVIYSDNERIVAVFDQSQEVEGSGSTAGGFSVFEEGSWKNYTSDDVPGMPAISGFSDVVFNPTNKRYYFASLTGGLLEWDPSTNAFRQFTAALEGVSLNFNALEQTPVSRLSTDAAGFVWMLQPSTNVPLHRFDPSTGSWKAYLAGNKKAGEALDIMVLSGNDKWLQLNESEGILVFNEEEGQSKYVTGQTSGGVLLDKTVTAMVQDLEGQLWVGLGKGVNYFPSPNAVLKNPSINIAFPVYQNRHLLNSEKVTSIAVDGGNRKWIGTTNGLWVVGDYGDTIYYNFTTANSPLPDNSIKSMAINQDNGEIFIATSSGIVSHRTGATKAGYQHAEAIKVFPNPVYPGYSGKVGITGLASDVVVKITDVTGKLVKELVSEGGTASWDLTDTRGKRPGTGVYLIFSATVDGVETLAGKMAIIN